MPNSATATQSKTQQVKRWFQPSWKLLCTGSFLTLTTLLTGFNHPLLGRWERQVHTLFFEVRGPKVAPEDIVILAIDEESLSQAEHYRSNPEKYKALAPIQQWPWKREAYAIVVQRLMQAGARAVSLDVLLFTDSSYGSEDDLILTNVLERYSKHVTLAATYQEDELRQGLLLKPTLPIAQFQNTGVNLGTINSPIEINSRIHRQGHTYLEALKQSGDLETSDQRGSETDSFYSFAEATLNAAQIAYSKEPGADIDFFGPTGTFQHIPFWYVLDPDPWQNYLQSGAVFKDKIVLIGSTASLHQDFHAAPFSKTFFHADALAGVEILANDITTLRSGNALKQLLPFPWLRAGLVLLVGTGLAVALQRSKHTWQRLGWAGAVGCGWVAIGFISFTGLNLWLPTATVTTAIVVVGGSYTLVSLTSQKIRKQRLRDTLAQYVTSPIVQEIISQEEDFQDLLEARQAQVVGSVLGGRYRVLKVLGSGGFSETYTAEDTQRPRQPVCVVKQLKIISDDPNAHHLAHRLFLSEADTLERLGHHEQIPRLLAHFETNSAFYLVEEMIEGTTLKLEMSSRQPKSQAWAMNFLLDLLPVVEFVHSQGVIHRDIKPSNLIRRAGDGRLVLIDFGSVKQISNKLTDTEAHVTSTVGIGTKGYMPSEQSAGLPRFSSDLYAIGTTVIEALTGMPPHKWTYDDHGELIWQYRVPDLNPALANILNKMVRYDFSKRYSSAIEVLAALKEIPLVLPDSIVPNTTVPYTLDQSSDDEECWDEPTGFLPTDWVPNEAIESNVAEESARDVPG